MVTRQSSQRSGKQHRRVREKLQGEADVLVALGFILVGQQMMPLVDCNDHGHAAVVRITGDGGFEARDVRHAD